MAEKKKQKSSNSQVSQQNQKKKKNLLDRFTTAIADMIVGPVDQYENDPILGSSEVHQEHLRKPMPQAFKPPEIIDISSEDVDLIIKQAQEINKLKSKKTKKKIPSKKEIDKNQLVSSFKKQLKKEAKK